MGRGGNGGTTQDAPPPYYTNGMENKGLERSMDVIEDLKNFDQQNGYISYNGLHHQPNGNGSKSSSVCSIHTTFPFSDTNCTVF